MKRSRSSDGPGAIELVEEAVHLLRGVPAGILASYAVGTLPFVLAFLYFWAEMSRGAFAREHAGVDALGLGLVFLWMKWWQAVFAGQLRARVTGLSPVPWTFARAFRLALTQTALQPIGLFLIPLSTVVVLPSAWVYAFFQNVTVLGGDSTSISETSKTAAAQASLRQGQSFVALTVLTIFGVFVWINIATFMAFLPGLLKTLLGLDNSYTRAGSVGFLNSTAWATSFALTYLCVDPLAKAMYALRCFYGESLQTGEDLKADLSRYRAQAAAALLIFICLTVPAISARGDAAVSPARLSQSIDEIQKKPQFAWRMPREAKDDSKDAPQSWLARTLHDIAQAIIDCMKWIAHSIAQTIRWVFEVIRKLWPQPKTSDSGASQGFEWASFAQILLLILIVVVATMLGVLIVRMIRNRRMAMPAIMAEPMTPAPDLNDENVAASQLPEEGWLSLARDLMAQGNLRLALRALYLAGLAHLAERELISIAIFKSNREYETELRRRARARPETLAAFSQNVAVFDRVWYGLHNVTAETMQEFQANLERIRAC